MNTMQYASVFMTELDKQLVEKSTTGWMEDNAAQVQYNGGAEVKIPKMTMSGLGDYDRNSGFAQGAVAVTYDEKKGLQGLDMDAVKEEAPYLFHEKEEKKKGTGITKSMQKKREDDIRAAFWGLK